MASQRQLKTRIRSVKSTKQITKAMQMVAASKMRRAQDATKASAPYERAANELLAYLQSQGTTNDHKWFVIRPVKCRLLIVIASDKGLAGAYNSNVLRRFLQELKKDEEKAIESRVITVGKKSSSFVSRLKNIEIIGSYDDLPDQPGGSQFHSILNTAKDAYENKQIDAVDVVYTKFVSSINQVASVERLFPAGIIQAEVPDFVRDALYEPSPEAVLDDVAYRLIGSRLYQTLLDARASEHSMRMLAMKNATDNASDLVEDLTLAMNKARQASITQELSEISAGVEAMK